MGEGQPHTPRPHEGRRGREGHTPKSCSSNHVFRASRGIAWYRLVSRHIAPYRAGWRETISSHFLQVLHVRRRRRKFSCWQGREGDSHERYHTISHCMVYRAVSRCIVRPMRRKKIGKSRDTPSPRGRRADLTMFQFFLPSQCTTLLQLR